LNNFVRRTLTGAWIVVFVLGGFWLHPVSFFLTGLIILAGAQYEYYRMIEGTGVKVQMITGILAGVTAYTISTFVASGSISPTLYLVLIPVMLFMMAAELYRKQEKPFDSLAHTLFSILYIAVPFCLFPFSAYSHTGLDTLLPHSRTTFSPGIVVGFFILLWANDTGAYLTGMTLGRHRLMERISPKKSWEGFIGGVLLSVIIACLLSEWLGEVNTFKWIIISVLISVTGTYGDLVESMLKRSIGLKDSGKIMPGHGGFLDRFDSTVMSFPIVYLFILLFG